MSENEGKLFYQKPYFWGVDGDDDDDDGGGDDGGRISGQGQPPNPITPRDEISRSGTRPHSDLI